MEKISEETKEMLEENLDADEVKDNLMQMLNGKSPGEDGLPKEFYQQLWDIIGEDITSILQATLDRELLPHSNTRGLTRLLSKVTPPAVPRVTELRPITRLNVDYKLLSRCLASRTRRAMPQVVRSRQLSLTGKEITEGVHNALSAAAYVEKKHEDTGDYGGFAAQYDNVKAFDLTSTAYCDLVMDVMNFGSKFRRWFLMMNRGASTRLLLPRGRLSREIQLSTSVRQGDPFALLAYEIQFEPFLRRLEAVLAGVTLGSRRPGLTPNPAAYTEKGSACVDDNVVISSCMNDLLLVDQVAARYEEQSGVMLSRTHKSKIMFLGSWRNPAHRPPLPVHYLKEVQELKMFGIVVTPHFKKTIQRTWEDRIAKMRGSCIEWSTRDLPTLHQRVQVLNTYITSKISYHALVLPLPPMYASQLEQVMRRFLYRGMITMEKLKLEELAHQEGSGGLGLVDVRRKCAALFLKHTMRMLQRQEGGWQHISYWLHHHLPHYTLHDGPRNLAAPPPYFLHMKKILQEMEDRKTEQELRGMRTKEIYALLCKELEHPLPPAPNRLLPPPLPPPRLLARHPGVEVGKLVFPRLANNTLNVQARFVLFSVVNRIFRNNEHMFRVWERGDPTCTHNPDITGQCAGVLQTPAHLLQTCGRVSEAWDWLRMYIFSKLLPPDSVSDEQFLNLQYEVPKSQEDTVIWLLGMYYEYVVRETVERGRVVGAEELRAYLGQRLLAHHLKRLRPLTLDRM